MSGALAMDGVSESRVLSLPLGGLLDFERWLETIRFFVDRIAKCSLLRQTDHATPSVAIGRIVAAPNN